MHDALQLCWFVRMQGLGLRDEEYKSIDLTIVELSLVEGISQLVENTN